MEEQKTHKRRERYKGTHPKNFKDKYKEHEPEKYATDVQKIIEKGKTPAGMHISICVDEILDILKIRKGEKGLDATLGYGGHARKMLEELDGEGHVYGIDVDPIEIVKTTKRLRDAGFSEDIFTSINTNFANLAEISEKHGKFDFVLADLGLSSMQIDNPERGFSFKRESALDLRLNPEKGISASERLMSISMMELENMLIENSDEPYAHEISVAIMREIKRGTVLDTTTKLRKIVEGVIEADKKILPSQKKLQAKKACQRVFQAIRIDINQEFEVLDEFLEALPNVMAEGSRIAILTFHSGEDRRVKQAFKALHNEGFFTEISRDVIRASDEECRINPRATSAKLRFAKR